VRHLQSRSGKIVSIKVRNYVKQQNIRQKTQRNATAGAAANVTGGDSWSSQIFALKDRIVERACHPKVTRLYIAFRTALAAGRKRTPTYW
jgi:hypothetical protein